MASLTIEQFAPDGVVNVEPASNAQEAMSAEEFAPDGILVQGSQPRQSPVEQRTPAESFADEALGVDSTITERSDVLPFSRNAEGNVEFTIPRMLLGLARGTMLPAAALEGTPITQEDVLNMGLEFGGAAVGRGLVRPRQSGRFSKQQLENIASSDELLRLGSQKYKKSRQATERLNADDFLSFMADSELRLAEEGVDAVLHPKLSRIFEVMSQNIGREDIDIGKLMTMRRQIGIALQSIAPEQADERRIAEMFRDQFDDFVEGLPGSKEWREARKLWAEGRKAETIEEVILEAEKQASGFENGLRIQFDRLLKNKKRSRGFTKKEKDAMRKLAKGDFTTNALRRIGRAASVGLGRQTNTLGANVSAGLSAAAGSVLGGPLVAGTAAVAAPIVGTAAAKAAEVRSLRAANAIRAMAAGEMPQIQNIPQRRRSPGRQATTAIGSGSLIANEIGPENLRDGLMVIDPDTGLPATYNAEIGEFELIF